MCGGGQRRRDGGNSSTRRGKADRQPLPLPLPLGEVDLGLRVDGGSGAGELVGSPAERDGGDRPGEPTRRDRARGRRMTSTVH